MIGEIGRAAGMKTVAEYVQSGSAFTLLGELGIDFAQGFYIGRPTVTPIRKTMPVPIIPPKQKKGRKEKKQNTS
jgi:EAL domain-containing protein (putative c-di-GMP-specific phosphodiesterase class I)